jgi:hypothetical protein
MIAIHAHSNLSRLRTLPALRSSRMGESTAATVIMALAPTFTSAAWTETCAG